MSDLNKQLGVKNWLFLELYSHIHAKLLKNFRKKVVIVKKIVPEEKVILETQVLP